MEGSLVETHSILEAGTVVPPGRRIPTGELWAGNPARFVRTLTHEETLEIPKLAVAINDLSKSYFMEFLPYSTAYLEVEKLKKKLGISIWWFCVFILVYYWWLWSSAGQRIRKSRTLKARALLLWFVLNFDCKRRNWLQVQNIWDYEIFTSAKMFSFYFSFVGLFFLADRCFSFIILVNPWDYY